MQFKDYQSRPITRSAAQIPAHASILYWPEQSEAEVDGVRFKCYEKPLHGDYVCWLKDDDVYHCSKAVFEDRNIVPA
ncbi:hypothetical protein HOR19_gp02 [Phage MedPE-SWcel-C56]|uniref:Uncharacterized protein n=1 Tax=Phage MedPE-SWcel-C56 TaxID=1871314 RepID=A0A1B1IXZ2_9CAUD|nr:hypothetical protein HOR19_gp02 [Phage MedPE-SWcel-C56]ANS06195.1 hypothetical protein [Phage MedPE-SWcel-C56]